MLSKIVKTRDPAAFGLLLFLRASDAQCGLDEREEAARALADFPGDVYASELAKASGTLARSSPRFLEDLIPTVIGRDVVEAFLSELPPLAPAVRDSLLAAVGVFNDDEPDEVKARVRRLRDGIRAGWTG